MKYSETVTLKDGRACVLRNACGKDGQAVLDIFLLTHEQTEYLTTYPEESTYTALQEAEYMQRKADSPREIEILAEVDGVVAGCAGIGCVRDALKTRHRAEFGISVDRALWGLGIGRALTQACLHCAQAAGYAQVELEAVAENERALALYRSVGFVEYGRNPRGFRKKSGDWQPIVLMRMELEQ